MSPPRALRKISSVVGQEDRAVGPRDDEPLPLEARNRLDDRGLRDPEPAGDVDGSRLARLTDEVGNQLDIVLRNLGVASFAGFLEIRRLLMISVIGGVRRRLLLGQGSPSTNSLAMQI